VNLDNYGRFPRQQAVGRAKKPTLNPEKSLLNNSGMIIMISMINMIEEVHL
jgi:hypothetical protein